MAIPVSIITAIRAIVMPYKKWLNNGTILSGDYVDTSESAVTWEWHSPDGKLGKKETHIIKNGEFVAPE